MIFIEIRDKKYPINLIQVGMMNEKADGGIQFIILILAINPVTLNSEQS